MPQKRKTKELFHRIGHAHKLVLLFTHSRIRENLSYTYCYNKQYLVQNMHQTLCFHQVTLWVSCNLDALLQEGPQFVLSFIGPSFLVCSCFGITLS